LVGLREGLDASKKRTTFCPCRESKRYQIYTVRIFNYFVLFVNGIGPVEFFNSKTKLRVPTLLMPKPATTTSPDLTTIFIKKIRGKIILDSMQTHSAILPTEYKIRAIFQLGDSGYPLLSKGCMLRNVTKGFRLVFFGRQKEKKIHTGRYSTKQKRSPCAGRFKTPPTLDSFSTCRLT
jgi:hypothetical protein